MASDDCAHSRAGRALDTHLRARHGESIQSYVQQSCLDQDGNHNQRLHRLGSFISLLKPHIKALEAASDYKGAAKLREYIQQNKLAFDELFAAVRQEEASRNQELLQSVVAFENQAFVQDWGALASAYNGYYDDRRALLQLAEGVQLARTEAQWRRGRLGAGARSPKPKASEMALERHMKALGRSGQEAEAAKVQVEVLRNRAAAVQRFECMQQQALSREKGSIREHFKRLAAGTALAQNTDGHLLRTCKAHDAGRMATRHRIYRHRITSSAAISSSQRVLAGWPHRKAHLPHTPGTLESGPVVPSAGRSPPLDRVDGGFPGLLEGTSYSTSASSCGDQCSAAGAAQALLERESSQHQRPATSPVGTSVGCRVELRQPRSRSPSSRSEGAAPRSDSGRPATADSGTREPGASATVRAWAAQRAGQKPPAVHTFRPAIGDVNYAAGRSGVVAATVSTFLQAPVHHIGAVRPHTSSGRPQGRILNKSLAGLQDNRDGCEGSDVLRQATTATIDFRHEID